MQTALGAKAVSVVASDDHLLLRLRLVIPCASTRGPTPAPVSWLIRIVPALKKPALDMPCADNAALQASEVRVLPSPFPVARQDQWRMRMQRRSPRRCSSPRRHFAGRVAPAELDSGCAKLRIQSRSDFPWRFRSVELGLRSFYGYTLFAFK